MRQKEKASRERRPFFVGLGIETFRCFNMEADEERTIYDERTFLMKCPRVRYAQRTNVGGKQYSLYKDHCGGLPVKFCNRSSI